MSWFLMLLLQCVMVINLQNSPFEFFLTVGPNYRESQCANEISNVGCQTRIAPPAAAVGSLDAGELRRLPVSPANDTDILRPASDARRIRAPAARNRRLINWRQAEAVRALE